MVVVVMVVALMIISKKTTNYSGTSIDFDLSVMRIGIGHTKHKQTSNTTYYKSSFIHFWWTLWWWWWWTDVLTTHTIHITHTHYLNTIKFSFFFIHSILPASQPAKNHIIHFWTHLEFIHSFKQLWLIVSWMWNPKNWMNDFTLLVSIDNDDNIYHSLDHFHFMQTNTPTLIEREWVISIRAIIEQPNQTKPIWIIKNSQNWWPTDSSQKRNEK